jgi:PAS domain S-box-containing protein
MDSNSNSDAVYAKDLQELRTAYMVLQEQYKSLLSSRSLSSDQAYLSILDSISELIYIQDEGGRFLYVNRACEICYGYSRDFFIGKTPEFLSAPGKNDLPAIASAISAAINKTPGAFEFWGLKKDGTVFLKSVNLFPGEYQAKPAVFAIARDITEIKNTENELQAANERLKTLIEAIPDAIFFKDGEGRWLITNDAAKDLFKLNEFAWEGKTDRMLADERPEFRDEHLKCIEDDELAWKAKKMFVANEYIHDGSSPGREFEVRKVPLFEKDGSRKALVVVGAEITEKKRTKKLIVQLSRVVEQSPVGIIIITADGAVEYTNRKVTEITGYQRDELNRIKYREICFSGMHTDELQKISDVLINGEDWKGEFYNRKRTGESYWAAISISPIVDDAEKFSKYLVILEDISDRKALESVLITEREKAESASKLKDAFIANISHEIRTPLNGILGMSSMIHETFLPQLNADTEKLFFSLKKSSKRLLHTVDMILNYSRMQIGDFPIECSSVSLSSVIQKILSEYALIAAEKSLRPTFYPIDRNDTVLADQSAIETVFENIIDNAIKYTERGSIEITIDRNANRQLCVTVKDTGVGISEAYLSNLFSPYSQEETGYSRRYEGMGLGLPIVKKLLDFNKATIEVQSRKGEGSTFIVTFLDSVEYESANDSLAQENLDRAVSKKRNSDSIGKPVILLVEDDIENQFLMRMVLKNEYDLVIAKDGDSALLELEKQPFDLILMDISLSQGMNGLDLTKRIRKIDRMQEVPIIVVSGHASSFDRHAALAAGCDDFLAKPFEIDDLYALVKQYLSLD